MVKSKYLSPKKIRTTTQKQKSSINQIFDKKIKKADLIYHYSNT